MSTVVHYGFNSDVALPELARQIEQAVGCALTLDSRPDPNWQGTIYRGNLFGLNLRLGCDHEYDNEGELNFYGYRYELCNVARSGPHRPRLIQVEMIALAAYALHKWLDIHEGMLG